MTKFLLIISFVVVPFFLFSQEDIVPENNNVIIEENPQTEVKIDEVIPVEAKPETPDNLPNKEKKVQAKDKEKLKKKEGPALLAIHKKQGIERAFYIGEKLKYRTKTDKKKMKGTFEAVEDGQVIIDGKKVKVEDLIMLGKKFGKTMGWRSAGVGRFALGAGIAAVGLTVGVLSGREYSVDNPNVVLATAGVAVGTGIGLVGVHLMVKGGKGVFQSSNKKKKNGWIFKLK
jgi:hypothetical protein